MLDFNELPPYAWSSKPGAPQCTGQIRVEPDDFRVVEQLGFEPDGEGSHWLVQVTKTGQNTVDAAHWLSSLTGVRVRDIGYCGLKDRHAVTTQWFSLPGHGVDGDRLAARAAEGFCVDQVIAHGRKLRRGAHRANQFELVIRNLVGEIDQLGEAVDAVAATGVPNYFGPQRFGMDGGNVQAGIQMLLSGQSPRRRSARGILMSSLRSMLFNNVLAHRVAAGTWNTLQVGDVAMLDGSRSHFHVDALDDVLLERVAAFDIHPTGPMPGDGESPVTGAVAEMEAEVIARAQIVERALVGAGLKQERRSLRLYATQFSREIDPAARTLRISFSLPRGSYATAVLREIVRINTDQPPWGPKG